MTGSDVLQELRTAGSNPVVRQFPEGAIVVFDTDLRYLCAGGHGLATVGLSPATVEGRTVDEVFPPAIASRLEEPYRRALSGEESTIEIDVGERTFQHRIAPLTDGDGVVVAGIGFALDVTEPRRAERAARASEARLREEDRRLRDAEAVGHAGSWEWDMVTDVITWSDGLFAIHGLDRATFAGGYAQAAARIHPEDRGTVDDAMESCRRDVPVRFRYRIARASDGRRRWLDSRARGVFEDGTLVRLVGAVADVTEQVQAEAEVIESHAFQTAVIAASPDYTFITDLRTGAMVFGSRDRDLLGRSAEQNEALGPQAIEVLVHPDDKAKLRALNDEASRLEDGQVLHLHYRLLHVDGQWHWLSRRVVPFRRDEAGSVVEVLGVLRDITDEVEAREQPSHDALHDGLTGLPTRALLLDRLETALLRADREGREIAVLFCDLDGFRHVNVTGGHAAGDAVLMETAARLRAVLRDGDTVARVGGDEFVVIVEPWNRASTGKKVSTFNTRRGRDIALRVAGRIVTAVRKPIMVDGVAHEITVSVGVTYPSLVLRGSSRRHHAPDVVEDADAAMYRAKLQGHGRVEVFSVGPSPSPAPATS
jgi:diguanylate cyclase (GGDEF)-like protein/PAS domain S-box-containing protein